jgi:hypothetical protein
MRKVGRINPVARALLRSRRNTSTVDSKKRYNRKKDKTNEERVGRDYYVSEDTSKEKDTT